MWQHHFVGVFFCDWCTLHKSKGCHKERTLCRNIEATYDVRQEVKAWAQMALDSDPKDITKLVTNWFQDYKVSYGVVITLLWPLHNSVLQKMCGRSWKVVYMQGDLQTWLTSTSSVRRNGPECYFTVTIVRTLWKETRDISRLQRPKACCVKATLPNTKEVYVNLLLCIK